MNKLYSLLFLIFMSVKVHGQVPLPITGTKVVCVGGTTTLHDATPGGFWISGTPSIAIIDSFTGVLTGVSAGTVSIGYQNSSGIVSATITVNPTPVLSSALSSIICDSSIFNYTPMSTTAGATFAWSRAIVGGIAVPASSGTGNPNEQLINTTYTRVAVAYSYTLTAGGCSNVQTVIVTVNPVPVLSSTLTPGPICDSALFTYVPTSLTPGATFAWNRPSTAGILMLTSFGSGGINEYLDNTTGSPVVVTYYYRLSIGSCINLFPETVQVTVGTCHVGVNELTKEEDLLHIYPDPSNGAFTVELPEGGVTMFISDVAGRQVASRTVSSSATRQQVFSESMRPGIYVLRVVSDDFVATQRLVIQ
jgi:hypothetical protein